jgi:T5SS/PEP-CTERM-associated repeat protein
MNGSDDGWKPVQSGLVDMGFNHFYDDADLQPTFLLSDLANAGSAISEMVLNVTWAELEPTSGQFDFASIDSAVSAVSAYNTSNGTDLGIKLRVWGAVVAPDWVKNLDGPPIAVSGKATIDPSNYGSRTFARVWTADYNDAWQELQTALAQHVTAGGSATYDGNPIIRGISQTAGGTASDEPFVSLPTSAPISSGASQTVDQFGALVNGGYSDYAEMLTLRAAIASYAAWATTPLDYTINPYHLYADGNATNDENFANTVLQQTRNSTRLVQAGNHALDAPQHGQLPFLYAQLTADAALTTAAAPNSYQTASPDLLYTHSSTDDPLFPASGGYSNWPNAVASGVLANGGDIELWSFSGPQGTTISGYVNMTSAQMAALADIVANGVAPMTGPPADGSPLDFLAPAFITGTAGTMRFSGTNAVLLESGAAETSYSVTLTSLDGHTLSVVQDRVASSGTTLTVSGTLDQVNTVLASLTDTLSSGTDVVQISASDTGGHSAQRNVGVQVVAAGSSSGFAPQTPPAVFSANGVAVLGGVQASLGFAGDLLIGPGGYAITLFAALAPNAYATATLSVGSAFHVASGGAAYVTGLVTAATVEVDSGGLLNEAGVISGAIVNGGTIEAMADLTLGLQRLEIRSDIAGSGTLKIDAGATLLLDGAVASSQVIEFAPNTSAQLGQAPYTPSTLVLASPPSTATITGFSYADRIVLSNVAVGSASYAGSTLSVFTSGGPVLTYTLTGDLAGLTLDAGAASQGIIQFGPPVSPTLPGDTVVDQIVVPGGTVIEPPGHVTANGIGGVALSVDGGGTLGLAGGSVVTAEQSAIVGDAGSGTLVVMGGALEVTASSSTPGDLVIGAQHSGSGTVLDLEQIAVSGAVVVGSAGSGTLELRGVAASLSAGSAIIGQGATGTGTVRVNGGEWMTSGALTVGGAGSGTLTIDGSDDGVTGQVTAYNVNIGNQASGHGTVLLDSGELLVANYTAASNTLAVGLSGTGELTLQGASEVAIGYALGGAVVSGQTVSNTGHLTVGTTPGGQGTVTIGDDSSILVYGDATVGGAGVVTLGGSAGDNALLATTVGLTVNSGGVVGLGDANAAIRAPTIDVAAGGVISGLGTLSGDLGGNQTTRSADIVNDGTIKAKDGDLLLYGDITGSGTLSIASGATMTLEGSVASGQTVHFSPHATLVIADPQAFHGQIAGFDASDTLEIGGEQASSVTWSSGTMTITLPSGALHYGITGDYTAGFTTQADGLGGSTLSAKPDVVGIGEGDVHMTTFDGLHYDFQAVGDFVVAQSTDAANPWEIQMRTTSWGGAVSVTQVLGTMVGDVQVTFAVGRDDTVHIDGVADTALQVGDVQQLGNDDGSLAWLSDNVYRLDWANGESMTVTNFGGLYLDWSVALGPNDAPGSVHGLLGSNTGQANDFQLRDGTVLPQPLGEQQMLGLYADSWRVTPGASLLDDPQATQLTQLVQAMAAPPATLPPATTDSSASTTGPMQDQNFHTGFDFFAPSDVNRPSDSGY